MMEAIRKQERYTYEDYLKWDDDVHYELIDGVPYAMAAPTVEHQRISSELHGQLWTFLKGKPCRPFTAPIDVRLNARKGDNIVVQPDLLVVCDHSKIEKNSINGAPDLIIEILSPSSLRHDKLIKFNKYMEAGVREYWVVEPEIKTITVHVLRDGKYTTDVYGDGNVPVSVLNGCEIDLNTIFI
jgi:Uma2 family endonuclease